MKICVAQTRAAAGDVQKNIDNHKKFAKLAASRAADMIIFPELSLTGYEPTLAKELATHMNDGRFEQLQNISDSKRIIIGAGMPITFGRDISIGMILFQPNQLREIYFKQHVHPDEKPYFVSGISRSVLSENKIAMAICYEISVPGHAEQAHESGASIYIASVAKTAAGVSNAIETLAGTAKKYSMTVLMSNCVGINDAAECGGRSSVWNNEGTLLGQLDDSNEGFIIFDTGTEKITKEQTEYSFS